MLDTYVWVFGIAYITDMTIEKFELLNECEKEEAVWYHGIFLNNYTASNNICNA